MQHKAPCAKSVSLNTRENIKMTVLFCHLKLQKIHSGKLPNVASNQIFFIDVASFRKICLTNLHRKLTQKARLFFTSF